GRRRRDATAQPRDDRGEVADPRVTGLAVPVPGAGVGQGVREPRRVDLFSRGDGVEEVVEGLPGAHLPRLRARRSQREGRALAGGAETRARSPELLAARSLSRA